MEEEKKENITEETKVEPIVITPPTEKASVEPVVESLTEEEPSEPVVIESITEEQPTEPAAEQPAEETSAEPVVEQPVEQPAEEAKVEPVAVETTNEQPVEEEKIEEPVQEEKKKKKNPLLFVLPLVVVIIAVVALLLMQKPNKQNKDEGKKEEIITDSDIKSDYRMSGNSIEAFDLYFLKLENKAENKIYSPLSIKYALGMLAEGANGDSKEQIKAIIGDYQTKKYDNSNNMSFGNAMFIRDSFKEKVKQDYVDVLTNKYGADVIEDQFTTPENINNWVSNKTFNIIKDLVKDVNNKDFVLVNALGIDMKWINQIHCATGSMKNVPCYDDGAYYVTYYHEKLTGEDSEYQRVSYPYTFDSEFYHLNFNGKEKTKSATVLASFNRYDAVNTLGEDRIRNEVGNAFNAWLETEEAKMYEYNGTVDEYLNGYISELNENYGKTEISTDFMLYTDDNVKAFAKDLQTYDGTTLQYVGIMPTSEDLNTYVDKVTVKDITSILENLKELKIENFQEGYATIIEGEIPLFKYEYELNLKEDLIKLGVTDVFNSEKADLSGMLKDSQGSYINEASHKANIEFSNEGIKAAAATAEGGAGNTGGGFNYLFEVPTIRIDLTFNKPYLYLIRDKNSGEVWFIGTVYQPLSE